MKKVIAGIIGLAALATMAQAQGGGIFDVGSAFIATNFYIPAANTYTNTGTNAVIDVANATNLGIQFSSTNSALSAAENVTLSFKRSVDGVHWESTAGVTWAQATASTTEVGYVTNWPCLGYKKLWLYTIANGAATGTFCSTSGGLKVWKK